ncbi:hypothetical protein nbrc107697_14930 [Gordonia crocea]|uniref:DUF2550 domain-containing protein n=1 Tax=Gordonia crocea TaxID=589162 RepID=A0A7I9UW70_9ACTN|nr:hypothetical protein nbrc107697_14930 [Gordonia crocea]
MIVGLVILAVALVLALIVAGAALYRLTEIRNAGTPLLLRPVPAAEDQGWRHGSAHYGDDALVYYRLVTFWQGPTVRLVRSAIAVDGRREPRGTEREILDGMVVIELAPGADGAGGAYELGMTPDALTAFQAWLESAPPQRARRGGR